VRGVLAEADVGDPNETGCLVAKGAESHRDRPERIRGALAALILLGRKPKEQQASYAGGARPFGDPRDLADRKARMPRKGQDLGRLACVRVDEDRQNEHRRIEPRLGDEVS
jgi:hypothetical protein